MKSTYMSPGTKTAGRRPQAGVTQAQGPTAQAGATRVETGTERTQMQEHKLDLKGTELN